MIFETGGMQMHYDVHGRDGEPLLWLHGGMGIGDDWRHIFADAPAGYRLLAPDLRGHGRSTGAGPIYSFKQAARDVLALLDELAIDTVKVIGLSGGGISALHLATLAPARVSSMVVVSAPAVFPEQARAIQRRFSPAMFGEAEAARMRQRHSRPGQLDTLIAQVHGMADGDDPSFTTEQLGAIAADTLIVFGDRDPLYPVSMAVDLRTAIPKSWLWVVPNGGHGPIFGAAARPFAEMALAFLGGAFRERPAA